MPEGYHHDGSSVSWCYPLPHTKVFYGIESMGSEGEFDYAVNLKREMMITSYNGDDREVVIPEEIAGEPVVSIANYCFYDNDYLASITLPSSLLSIEPYAFAYCESLSKVAIPSKCEEIAQYAFYDCGSLMEVHIPISVLIIESYAFSKINSNATIFCEAENEPNGWSSWRDTGSNIVIIWGRYE